MEGEKMEGWLYVIHARRIRIRSPRKRYFLLTGNRAVCYKTKPVHGDEEPIRVGVIGSQTRIVDNGRETIHGTMVFVFTVYDSSNHDHKLKLGARSVEDAALWMQAFKKASEKAKVEEKQLPFPTDKGGPNYGDLKGKDASIARELDISGSLDWIHSLSSRAGTLSSDVIATSPWQIFGCKNGLRLFREIIDRKFTCKIEREDPALMAVGVVNASCESIFETVMALGPSRAEWDYCFLRGKVLEILDGHTDIVHMQLHARCHPRMMRRIDFVLARYWRRESDGSYVILYHSAVHARSPPQRGFVRAKLKSGGYVIRPLEATSRSNIRSLVKHMLAVNWKTLLSYMMPSLATELTINVLERVAALREFFKSKPSSCIPPGSLIKGLSNLCLEAEVDKTKISLDPKPLLKPAISIQNKMETRESFLETSETAEEFFDVEEDSGIYVGEDERSLHSCDEFQGVPIEDKPDSEKQNPKFFTAATFVKRLHELAASAQKQSHPEATNGKDTYESLHKEGTLPKCLSGSDTSCWNQADPNNYLIRGKEYLKNHKKVKAQKTLMELVGVDWFRSDKQEDHFARRLGSFMQKPKVAAIQGVFFLIINFQVPGRTFHFLVLYYAMPAPTESCPILHSFVNGDNHFRDSRFKLIPNIAKGSWIVKQSVGKTACLVGEALEINYFRGQKYLELDVNVGSSSIAKGVVDLVFGYLKKLVVEMAFLIQANTEEELPEKLIGTCRISSLDTARSVQAPSEGVE